MAARRHGSNFKVLRAHGCAGNAASGTPMAGCLGDVCFCDLSARGMARVVAIDSCAIRSAENAGCGGDFSSGGICGGAAKHGGGFLERFLGGGFSLSDETPAA